MSRRRRSRRPWPTIGRRFEVFTASYAQPTRRSPMRCSQAGDPAPAVEQITQIRGQLLVETVKMRQKILAVLSQDQLAKVAQLQGQLRALRAEQHNLLMGGSHDAP